MNRNVIGNYIPIYKSTHMPDYWQDEDKQIVAQGVIDYLKEHGLSPMEPPDEFGHIDIAYTNCRIWFNLAESVILLFKRERATTKISFRLYDPTCFDKLIEAIKSFD